MKNAMNAKEYSEYSDEELLLLIRQGNQEIVDYLLEKYKNLVKSKARTLFLVGGDHDDLIQEGMIGLYRAIRDYKPEKDSSFSNFAQLCITRQLYNAITQQNRKKNIPLNYYIPFESLGYSEENNPEELFIDRESTSMLEQKLLQQMSSMEKEVFRLFIEGMNYQQIAERMQKEPKQIDNALQRIKTKMNRIRSEK